MYARNSGLQNPSVIYVADELGGSERVLLDPNTFSDDGTVALTGLEFSDDGQLAAYGTSASGSDWLTWRVRDVATGSDLDDEVQWSKFSSASWLNDASGFFYARYAAPDESTQFKGENYNHQVYFHRLGTPQADDALVYERPDHKDWNFGTHVTEDGRWLILHVAQGSNPNNRFFVKDLGNPQAAVIEMLTEADAGYNYFGNDGDASTFARPKMRRAGVWSHRAARPDPVEIIPGTTTPSKRCDLRRSADPRDLHDARALVRRADPGPGPG